MLGLISPAHNIIFLLIMMVMMMMMMVIMTMVIAMMIVTMVLVRINFKAVSNCQKYIKVETNKKWGQNDIKSLTMATCQSSCAASSNWAICWREKESWILPPPLKLSGAENPPNSKAKPKIIPSPAVTCNRQLSGCKFDQPAPHSKLNCNFTQPRFECFWGF